jgi:CSLREA domain-containing protein
VFRSLGHEILVHEGKMINFRQTMMGIAATAGLTMMTAIVGANTITVNTLADPGSTKECSLRSAINASIKARAVDGCSAGSGADSVVFGSLTGKIKLEKTLMVDGSIGVLTITGPGITITGGDQVRIF